MATHTDDPLAAWTRATDEWLRLYSGLARDAVAASRATAAAFGLPAPTPEAPMPALPSMGYRERDWTVVRTVEATEEIGVGESVTFSKPITDEDVRAFARASGDTNRLHLDRNFAEHSRFGGRIVHGTLLVGLVSAALARLPGLVIYLSQDAQYLAPVTVGERVTATCEVVEDLGDDRFRLTTVVSDEAGETVVDGEAVVLVDDLPAE